MCVSNKWDMVDFLNGSLTSVPVSPPNATFQTRFVNKIAVSVQLTPCNLVCVDGPLLQGPAHTRTHSSVYGRPFYNFFFF